MSYDPRPKRRPASTRGVSPAFGAAEDDRVQVRVQEQRAAAARPPDAADDVHAARRELLELDLDTARCEPLCDEAADLRLPRSAGHERRVHRLDRDELRDELGGLGRPAHGRGAYRGFVSPFRGSGG